MGEAATMTREINRGNLAEGFSEHVAVVAQTVSEMLDAGKLGLRKTRRNLKDSPLKYLQQLGIDTSMLTVDNVKKAASSSLLQEKLSEQSRQWRNRIDNLALKAGVTREKIITDPQTAIVAMDIDPENVQEAEAAMLLAPAVAAELLPATVAGNSEGVAAIALMDIFGFLKKSRRKNASKPASPVSAAEPVYDNAGHSTDDTTALPELDSSVEVVARSSSSGNVAASQPEGPKRKPSKRERFKKWRKRNIWLEREEPKATSTDREPSLERTALPELDASVEWTGGYKSSGSRDHEDGSHRQRNKLRKLGGCAVIGVAVLAICGILGVSYIRGVEVLEKTPEVIPTPTRIPEDIDRRTTHTSEAKNFLKAYQDGKLKVNPLDLDSTVVKTQIAYNGWDWWKSGDADLLKRAFGDKLTPTEIESLRNNPNNLLGILQRRAFGTEGINAKYWQRLYKIYSARKDFIGDPEEFLKQMDKMTADEISQLLRSLNSESGMLRSGAYEGKRGNFGRTGLPKSEVLARNKTVSQAAKRTS